MPEVAFYNDNANRMYPFVDTGDRSMLFSGGGYKDLPDSAIVDLTAMLGVSTGVDLLQDVLYLDKISRNGSTLTFDFRLTTAELAGWVLQFSRDVTDAEWLTEYATMTDVGSLGSLGMDCAGFVLEGWLTTGDLTALAALLADGQTLTRSDAALRIEPARIQNLEGAFVRTVSLANQPRTQATPPLQCSGSSSSSASSGSGSSGSLGAGSPDNYVVNKKCLSGDLIWVEGHNCTIQQNPDENILTIGAAIGAGKGQVCEEVPLFTGEQPPAGSTLLSGGPSCNELIRSINGLEGPHVNFVGRTGVDIRVDDAAPNTIIVDLNLRGLAICNLSSSLQ